MTLPYWAGLYGPRSRSATDQMNATFSEKLDKVDSNNRAASAESMFEEQRIVFRFRVAAKGLNAKYSRLTSTLKCVLSGQCLQDLPAGLEFGGTEASIDHPDH